MKDQQKERWLELCEQAANEQDGAKLTELVAEITQLLEEKEARLHGRTSKAAPAPKTSTNEA